MASPANSRLGDQREVDVERRRSVLRDGRLRPQPMTARRRDPPQGPGHQLDAERLRASGNQGVLRRPQRHDCGPRTHPPAPVNAPAHLPGDPRRQGQLARARRACHARARQRYPRDTALRDPHPVSDGQSPGPGSDRRRKRRYSERRRAPLMEAIPPVTHRELITHGLRWAKRNLTRRASRARGKERANGAVREAAARRHGPKRDRPRRRPLAPARNISDRRGHRARRSSLARHRITDRGGRRGIERRYRSRSRASLMHAVATVRGTDRPAARR